MDTNRDSLSSALLQSMEAFAEMARTSTNGTITIEAKIVEVVDEGKGIYKVQYLGNTFEASSPSTEIVYNVDDVVYVVVPDGNFDKNKIILSPVSPVETTYASTEDSVSYITIGDNLFASVADIELCTYRPHDKTEEMVDTTGFAQLFAAALNDSRVFNFTCRIKTNIDVSRRAKGNYGLILDIPVIQEGIQKFYSVTLDINNLSGDLYNYADYALQKCYFELPADMKFDTSREPKISSFINGFIGSYSLTAPNDIWIKDIQLLSTLALVQEEISGYYMILSATEGTSFLVSRTNDKKVITPTLYLNGKVTRLNDFSCYWFRENCLIDAESDKFNRFGGIGWEILNGKTGVEVQEGGKETFQYVTNVYQQEVLQNDIHSTIRYKCVLVKDDKVVNQTITIKNLASLVDIQLVSATGSNTYVENVGRVRLIVKCYEAGITDVDSPIVNVNYAWQRFDKFGNYLGNDFYTVDRFNEKVIIDNKSYYETEISYPVSDIDELNSIYCTVYTESNENSNVKQIIAGTRSVLISTTAEAVYTIKVENGDKLYKYDADGDSPKVADYDGPLTSAIKDIPPINLTLFKPDGTEFTVDEYLATIVEWLVPVDSMISLTSAQKTDPTSNPGYYTIKGSYNNYKSLSYGILNTYNKKKLNNTIIIHAYFKDNTAENVANLRFLKDGESGTNGSKYSAIVTYNGVGYGERTPDGKLNKLQLIYAADEEKWYSWNPAVMVLNPLEYNATFATLGIDTYADGEKIANSTIEWNIFDISYFYDNIQCPFTITSLGELKLKKDIDDGSQWSNAGDNFCATVEAKVRAKRIPADDGQTNAEEYIYAYYPIEMTRVAKADYLGNLLTLDGGFSQVVYASDGTNPQYDNSNNFEVVNNAEEFYEYTWSTSSNLATRVEDKTCKVTPASKYDNGAAKNFVKVEMNTAAGAAEELANKIVEVQSELAHQNNRLSYYNTLQGALDIFQNFDYNSYIEDLQTASRFFNTKTDYIKTVKEFLFNLRNLLDKVELYLQKDHDARLVNLKDEIVNRINTFNNLLNLGCQLGTNTSAINLIKAVVPSSLLMTEFSVSPTDQSYFTTMRDAVKEYNTEILVIYTNYYDALDGTFIALQDLVKYVVDELSDFVNDSKWDTLSSPQYGISEQVYLYSGLVGVLKTYINNISNEDNYSYDRLINNILKPMKKTLDQFSGVDYTRDIVKINNKINDLTQELSYYQGIDLPDSEHAFIHIKPIIMIFNRYEMANINGWDGNKTTVEDGYILTPQVGAGKKENGLFTGVVMGVKQVGVKSSTNQRIGMFGYYQGKQSLFLNAKDGSAVFGLSGKGQVIIDPTAEKAMLYSSNYWKNYNPADGKPTSYSSSNLNGEGMLIDLTTPEIRYGNGNFVVTSDGHLTAKGGGTIAGWKIGDTQLYSDVPVSSGRLVLDSSGVGKIYSHNHSTLGTTSNGFYLSSDGLSIGSKVYIDNSGTMRLGYGAVSGGGYHWVINGDGSRSYIAYGTSEWHEASSDSSGVNDVYLGTNGFSIGRRFSVDSLGTIKAFSGVIGGWNISANSISKGNTTLSDTGTLTGRTWSITNSGVATFNNVVLKGATQSSSGQASYLDWGEKFKVDTDGTLHAKSAVFSGSIEAAGVKFQSDSSHYIYFNMEESSNKHPTVSGLNVESGGINMQGYGIGNCSNIGITDAQGTAAWVFTTGGAGILPAISTGARIKTSSTVECSALTVDGYSLKAIIRMAKTNASYLVRYKDAGTGIEYWGQVPIDIT